MSPDKNAELSIAISKMLEGQNLEDVGAVLSMLFAIYLKRVPPHLRMRQVDMLLKLIDEHVQ